MKELFQESIDLGDLATTPKKRMINFTKIVNIHFKAKNIDSCRLTGIMTSKHKLNGINVISSEMIGLKSTKVNWARTDIKDSSIRQTNFSRCSFDITSIMNNVVADTKFAYCTFNDTSITDTIFVNVTFTHCNLSNLIIKNCNFVRCVFNLCKTNNKLIEHCVVDRVQFYETNIFLETIQENFGMSKYEFRGCKIKIGIAYIDKRRALSKITNILKEHDEITPLEKLKLEFFVTGSLKNAAATLDDALKMGSWITLCRIPATFTLLLNGFSSFLINQYESDRVPLSPLLKLYYASNELATGGLSETTNTVLRTEFLATIYSASMKLLPYFENYLALIDRLSLSYFPRMGFRAEGPLDKRYYENILSEAVGQRKITIEKLIERNSPVDLWLFIQNRPDLVALLAIFIASRLKIEIQSIQGRMLQKENLEQEQSSRIDKSQARENTTALIETTKEESQKMLSFEIGLSETVSPTYRFKIHALFPRGVAASLLIETRVTIIYKIRNVLLELLKPHKSPEVSATLE